MRIVSRNCPARKISLLDEVRDPMAWRAFRTLWHGLMTMPQQSPARPHRPLSLSVALPATICREQRCSTYGVASEDVVVGRRRKVENDLARLAERYAGTGVDVEATACALAA